MEYCLKTAGAPQTVVLIHTVQADCLLRLIKNGWSVLISVLCSMLVSVMALEGQKKKKKGKQIKLTERRRDISAYFFSASRSFLSSYLYDSRWGHSGFAL